MNTGGLAFTGAGHVEACHTVHADEVGQLFSGQWFAAGNQRQMQKRAAMAFGELGGAFGSAIQTADRKNHSGVGFGGVALGAHQVAGARSFCQAITSRQGTVFGLTTFGAPPAVG